jgi:DNA-binding transcriptional ArsR family regulator
LIVIYVYWYIIGMATAFDVLAEPSRRRILDLLRGGESAVGDVVTELGMSQPAVSKHLRVLREAGVVEARVDAQRRLYRVRPDPLHEIDDWLAPYRRLWDTSLDALGSHLDRSDRGRRPTAAKEKR